MMTTMIDFSSVPVGLVPTGTDNVPTLSISERIQEEKISLKLWGEYIASNLGRFAEYYGSFPCSFYSSDGRHFCRGTLDGTASAGLVRLHESPAPFPDWGIGINHLDGLEHVSLWQLLEKTLKYKSLTSLANRFHEEPYGYSPFKLSEYRFSPEIFPESVRTQCSSNHSEESALQEFVNHRFDSYFPNGILDPIPAFPSKVADNWMVMAFDFTNEIGETMMKVLKAYRLTNDHQLVKCYLPQTRWFCKQEQGFSFTATVGLPDKQILFNLHLIAEAETVIICSSLEIALANQQGNPSGPVVFTAFVCDYPRFDQVDFSPIKNKFVKLLISNHSGVTLAECYLKTVPLYEYLRDEIKIVNIGFIQMAVSYPDLTGVYNVDRLMGAHRQQKPCIIDGSVIELDEAEFNVMVSRATAEIERKRTQSLDMSFWENTESICPVSSDNSAVPQKPTDKMILRPFIARGQITMIESAPGIGKSCLTTALCAQIVGSKAPFLTERCWTRCTPLDDPTRGYKVVYLTFDSDGAANIEEHRKDFAADLGEFDSNFIQRDMSSDMTDYTKEANYNQFVNLLKKFSRQGTNEYPIDVLVIDTLLTFAHGKVNSAHLVLRKLSDDFPNMAIILIHHLNKANETYGGVKGTMFPRVILSLYRTDEQTPQERRATLEDPFSIGIEKASMNKIPEDSGSFVVKLDSQNHFVVVEPKQTLDSMRKTLIDQYNKKYSLTQEEIGRLFGVTDKTIRNWK